MMWAQYLVGLIIFSHEKPDPWPDIFGYHEVFHVFVTGAFVASFFLNYSLLV